MLKIILRFFFLALPVILIIILISSQCYLKSVLWTPNIISLASMVFAGIIWIVGSIWLFFIEKKISPYQDDGWWNKLKYFFGSRSWGWVFPGDFRSRYAGKKFATFWCALCLTCYAFSIGVSCTTFFVTYVSHNNHISTEQSRTEDVNNTNQDSSTQTSGEKAKVAINHTLSLDENCNELNFLHNEGIFVVFFATFLGIYTWLNTEVMKYKGFRPIETLDELLETLRNALYGPGGIKPFSVWGKHGNIFYYVYDHTIATGHMSGDSSKFENYAIALHDFLRQEDLNIHFKAIVFNFNSLLIHYARLLFPGKYHNLNPDEATIVLNKMIEGHDLFVEYLNSDDIQLDDEKKINYRSHYYTAQNYKVQNRPIKPHLDNLLKTISDPNLEWAPRNIGVRKLFDRTAFHSHGKQDQRLIEITSILDKEEGKSDPKVPWDDNKLTQVICIQELGLTRFIVSNNFVLIFIAARNEHQNNKNVPAGFYSEDLILIERFKTAFEEYWKGLD
jgi:hypothetical protein